MPIIPERLKELEHIDLLFGSHESFDEGVCAMELCAYIAGEKHTDSPECASPVIAALVRGWNDGLPSDADRNRLLKPLLVDLIGSRSTEAIEERRSYMALDWLIRVHTPKFLDLVPTLHEHAKSLREIEDIWDMAGATAAGEKVRAAWAAACASALAAAEDAAGDAARAAAFAAAEAAPFAAAEAAAGAAAGAAARAAARAAAFAAAEAAARAAAGAAARAAARAAAFAAAEAAPFAAAEAAAGAAAKAELKTTVEFLQASANELLRRMLAVTESGAA